MKRFVSRPCTLRENEAVCFQTLHYRRKWSGLFPDRALEAQMKRFVSRPCTLGASEVTQNRNMYKETMMVINMAY